MISIRQSKNAKAGLIEMLTFINQKIYVKACKILEIGSYSGDSSEIFAKHCKKLYCVDPWENGYDPEDAASYQYIMSEVENDFDERMKKFHNVNKYKMTSNNFSEINKEKFDIIYIDALHTYDGCKSDIELFRDRIEEGGFLTGHDFQGRFQGVIKAVQEEAKRQNKKIKVFPDSSWVLYE